MKYIREGRFGMPKQYKTGAVVSTYPKPMLVLNFDEAGLDVIQDPIKTIKPSELDECIKKPGSDLPPITTIDFCDTTKRELLATYQVAPNKDSFQSFIDVTNKLVKANPIPWKTIVIDSITQLSETVIGHISATNNAAMADARKWAGNTGLKIAQILGVYGGIECHQVFIMHAETTTNEQTGEISVLPLIHSKLRNKIGSLLSQFVYATKEGGKPVIYTTDKGFIKGIGCRWPANLPPVCGVDFNSIYGKELTK